MSGLAWRLGLRRSPSGLDVTGTLRYPRAPRIVPPPEPPDLLLESLRRGVQAPFITAEELSRVHPRRYADPFPLPAPRWADPVVFGEPYTPDETPSPPHWATRNCMACGAQWRSETARTPCWACSATTSDN